MVNLSYFNQLFQLGPKQAAKRATPMAANLYPAVVFDARCMFVWVLDLDQELYDGLITEAPK